MNVEAAHDVRVVANPLQELADDVRLAGVRSRRDLTFWDAGNIE